MAACFNTAGGNLLTRVSLGARGVRAAGLVGLGSKCVGAAPSSGAVPLYLVFSLLAQAGGTAAGAVFARSTGYHVVDSSVCRTTGLLRHFMMLPVASKLSCCLGCLPSQSPACFRAPILHGRAHLQRWSVLLARVIFALVHLRFVSSATLLYIWLSDTLRYYLFIERRPGGEPSARLPTHLRFEAGREGRHPLLAHYQTFLLQQTDRPTCGTNPEGAAPRCLSRPRTKRCAMPPCNTRHACISRVPLSVTITSHRSRSLPRGDGSGSMPIQTTARAA